MGAVTSPLGLSAYTSVGRLSIELTSLAAGSVLHGTMCMHSGSEQALACAIHQSTCHELLDLRRGPRLLTHVDLCIALPRECACPISTPKCADGHTTFFEKECRTCDRHLPFRGSHDVNARARKQEAGMEMHTMQCDKRARWLSC